jgi:DNA-directed RNA polymerase specialized sigma24 family protein
MSALSDHLSDEELYCFLQKEDNDEAYNILYSRYWKRILYKSVLKMKSKDDAVEIVTDVFAEVWIHRKKRSIPYTFQQYLSVLTFYLIAKKMAENHRSVLCEKIKQDSILTFEIFRKRYERDIGELPKPDALVFGKK